MKRRHYFLTGSHTFILKNGECRYWRLNLEYPDFWIYVGMACTHRRLNLLIKCVEPFLYFDRCPLEKIWPSKPWQRSYHRYVNRALTTPPVSCLHYSNHVRRRLSSIGWLLVIGSRLSDTGSRHSLAQGMKDLKWFCENRWLSRNNGVETTSFRLLLTLLFYKLQFRWKAVHWKAKWQ